MNKEKEMKNSLVNRISKNKKQLIGKEISKGGTRNRQKISQSARILQVREKAKTLKEKIGMCSFLIDVIIMIDGCYNEYSRRIMILDIKNEENDVKKTSSNVIKIIKPYLNI